MENEIKTCGVLSCDGKYKALGFCRLHWERFKRTGTTEGREKKTKTPRAAKVAEPRACISCGKEFRPPNRHPHAQACSVKCRNVLEYSKRKAAEPSKPCERCGTLFNPLLPITRFCSRECGAAHTVEVREKEKTCTDCGKVFRTNARHSTCEACSYERRLVRVRARNKVRRYLRRGAAGPTHENKDWLRLVARHDGLCAYCGVNKTEHRDHVVPIARGGTDSIGNILPACAPCNLSKGSSLLIEWKYRVLNGRRKKTKTDSASINRR
jgi:5-methylcytosine-specific restriction endonuclease McrA